MQKTAKNSVQKDVKADANEIHNYSMCQAARRVTDFYEIKTCTLAHIFTLKTMFIYIFPLTCYFNSHIRIS